MTRLIRNFWLVAILALGVNSVLSAQTPSTAPAGKASATSTEAGTSKKVHKAGKHHVRKHHKSAKAATQSSETPAPVK